MASKFTKNLLNRSRLTFLRRTSSGFTLVELLISSLIGSIVVSALLALVVNLLQTDQQEFAQSETQRDMQAALDYISQDLREAVYVYSGECLEGVGTRSDDNFCPGIVNHVRIPPNSVPVLAFWKLEPLPKNCRDSSTGQPITPCTDFGIANRTFSLVVYYLRRNQSDDIWQGKARITRYELDNFISTRNPPASTTGYVNPVQQGNTNFRIWPYAINASGQLRNEQSSLPDLPGNDDNPTLVDFVDDTPNVSVANCPTNWMTPNGSTSNRYGFSGLSSFYACVRPQESQQNPDVIVYLRGNPYGRQGVTSSTSLPALRTQVLVRGVMDKDPVQ